ncbi:MAG TPA: hypothetical protein VMS60_06600 [Solirubrobacterales bacterium]|nr:hypothetical protein [Solirubrobacterales bacterium]
MKIGPMFREDDSSLGARGDWQRPQPREGRDQRFRPGQLRGSRSATRRPERTIPPGDVQKALADALGLSEM